MRHRADIDTSTIQVRVENNPIRSGGAPFINPIPHYRKLLIRPAGSKNETLPVVEPVRILVVSQLLPVLVETAALLEGFLDLGPGPVVVSAGYLADGGGALGCGGGGGEGEEEEGFESEHF